MAASPRPVRIVTDSTADLPADVASALGIAVVPLLVRFGDEVFRDGVDLDQAAFLAKLRTAHTLPQTSQPPTAAFEQIFAEAVAEGADVVCVTIASHLSGTYNSARLAAANVGTDRVRVIDSGAVTMQLGWAAIAASRAAQAGAGLEDVASAATSTLARGSLFAVLDTLEYLHRGGRIGKASQLVGTMLNIKPILTVRAGEVIPLERVRTWRRALDRIAELAREQAPLAELAVLHVGNPSDAQALADRLGDLIPGRPPLLAEAGPVIATYAGPGAVGVVPLAASGTA